MIIGFHEGFCNKGGWRSIRSLILISQDRNCYGEPEVYLQKSFEKSNNNGNTSRRPRRMARDNIHVAAKPSDRRQ